MLFSSVHIGKAGLEFFYFFFDCGDIWFPAILITWEENSLVTILLRSISSMEMDSTARQFGDPGPNDQGRSGGTALKREFSSMAGVVR